MPEWLEAIRTEVPDNQLKEFREVLRWVSSLMKSPVVAVVAISNTHGHRALLSTLHDCLDANHSVEQGEALR